MQTTTLTGQQFGKIIDYCTKQQTRNMTIEEIMKLDAYQLNDVAVKCAQAKLARHLYNQRLVSSWDGKDSTFQFEDSIKTEDDVDVAQDEIELFNDIIGI